VITGSAFKFSKYAPTKGSPILRQELNTDISRQLNQSSSNADASGYEPSDAALNRSATIQPPLVSADIFNFQSERMQKEYMKKKGELVNSIKQKDNLISFNSSSPRFDTQKQIQIVTGQDPDTGNLYIIKDEKTNLGPGYYKNESDINSMKKEFQEIVNRNRLKNDTTRLRPSGGVPGVGFGSSTTKAEGSNIQTAVNSKAYQGVVGQYYNEGGQSSMNT